MILNLATFSLVSMAIGEFSPTEWDGLFFLCQGCISPLHVFSGCVYRPLRSPLASLSGYILGKLRSPLGISPLDTASAVFSCVVPRKRWFGLQHGLLSHLWHTNNPFGIGPFVTNQAVLCDLYNRLRIAKAPYPSPSLPLTHRQHSSGPRLSTFDQKWSIIACVTLTNSIGLIIGLLALFISRFMLCVRIIQKQPTSGWSDYFKREHLCVNYC